MKFINSAKYFVILLIVFTCFGSCSQDKEILEEQVIDPEVEVIDPVPVEEVFNYTSSAKYNLNIVYFIPNDIENLKDSHRRLSEIFLHGQEFYKQNMASYGFGEKTYNLRVDSEKNRVKIIYIDGKHPTSSYPYEGGGAEIKKEIDAYFNSNPDEKESEHTIVIVPVEDQDNPDVPFYGWGKWCFALDYAQMDIKYFKDGTKKGADATKYIGGLTHELGHGLNLPHNKEKVSEYDTQDKGTALMGAGNYTYGNTPTFITKASCAILNNNQIFGNGNGAFYTGATLQINNIRASFENGTLIVSGGFTTDVEVNYVGFYNDPADDNADYDAVTWVAPVINDNEFNIVMPLNELHKKEDIPYVLNIRFNHINGEITTLSYGYKFENNVPSIEFGDKDYLDRTNWSIVSFSSQEDDGLASWILDDNPSTFWHSEWKNNVASYPHNIVVDMGENTRVNGFSFIQRNGMRKIKEIEILVSDDNESWVSKGEFELKNINTAHHINFPEVDNFRYFKFRAISAFDGDKFGAMAEIKCF